MLLHLIYFPLFLSIIIILGAFFSHILSKIILIDHSSLTDDLGLQGMFGLFFLGITGITFNFFLPLTSVIFIYTISACAVFGFIIYIKKRNSITKSDIFGFMVISLILAPLAGSMNPGYDGGLYHLPHQLWLRNESIVIGLANLHGRFGFSSLYEYISAPLWINNQFLLLSYLQASFVVFFLLFLIKQTKHAYGTHLALLFGVAINLVVFYGYNDYISFQYTSTDLSAGLLFSAAFIYGHWLIYTNQSVLRSEWTIFSILLLSAIFYKVSSVLLIIWFVFVLYYRIYWKHDSVRELLIGLAIPAGFMLIWILRNILTTGCLLYPESSSCLNVPWSAKNNAINDANWVTAWARHPKSGLYSLQGNSWFFNWWLSKYQTFLTQLIYAGLFVGILYGGVALRTKFIIVKIMDIRYVAAAGFIIIAFLFWFWKAPNPRFGIGVFILLFPVLFLFLHGKTLEISKNHRKLLQTTVVVGVIIFICQIGIPWKRLSFSNALTFNTLTVPTIEVYEDSVYGVRPVKRNQCWLVPECTPYNHPAKSLWHGKSIFYSK